MWISSSFQGVANPAEGNRFFVPVTKSGRQPGDKPAHRIARLEFSPEPFAPFRQDRQTEPHANPVQHELSIIRTHHGLPRFEVAAAPSQRELLGDRDQVPRWALAPRHADRPAEDLCVLSE